MSKRIMTALVTIVVCSFPALVAAAGSGPASGASDGTPDVAGVSSPDRLEPMACKGRNARCTVTADCCEGLSCDWSREKPGEQVAVEGWRAGGGRGVARSSGAPQKGGF
jgi:hypothetical protein